MTTRRTVVTVLASAALLVSASAIPAGARSSTDTIDGAVYFFMDNGTETRFGPHLAAAARRLDLPAPATAAMTMLLKGPVRVERTATPPLTSAIPAGTMLQSLTISGGVATVGLSSRFVSGGGTASMTGRLAQVVWTLTQFPTVDGVRFLVEGVPTTAFGGEGVIIPSPAGRMDFLDQIPAILVESPAYRGRAGGASVRVTGIANTFEASFMMGVYDGDGRILAETPVMASDGNGAYGTFDVTLPYLPGEGNLGSLIVWEASAQDGSQINVREYPIRLGPGVHCARAPATILGTWGDDTITGTAGNDVIVAFGGNDRIEARRGHDTICAGPGHDVVLGGPGRDLMLGEGGNDRLFGGAGFADRAIGGRDSDLCVAERTHGCER